MTHLETYVRYAAQKFIDAYREYQKTNQIKLDGFGPLELILEYNAAIEDAERYRWLRDTHSLDSFQAINETQDRNTRVSNDIQEP